MGRSDVTDELSAPLVEYVFPRERAMVVGVGVGVAIGIGNASLGVLFPSWPATFALLVGALAFVLLLHEGLHGLAGKLFGYKPLFGVEPPLVYTTFNERIRRTHLLVIALAPLVVLDVVFVVAYALAPFRIFWNLCFAVNTIGAIGDCWIARQLVRHDSDTWFQDTKSGVEAWVSRT